MYIKGAALGEGVLMAYVNYVREDQPAHPRIFSYTLRPSGYFELYLVGRFLRQVFAWRGQKYGV